MSEPRESVLTPHLERALRYLAALEAGGDALPRAALDQFATMTPPAGPVMSGYFQTGLEGLMSATRTARSGHAVTDYFLNQGWVECAGEHVYLTPRGKALLRGLSDPSAADTRNVQPLVVVLQPNDAWNDYHLVRAISEAGEGMLVDPWLNAAQTGWLAERSEIRRVLTSSRTQCLTGMPELLAGFQRTGSSRLLVRAARKDDFHDRAIVHQSGKITVLGTSLNGVGHKLSVMFDLPSAAVVGYRKALEALWEESVDVTASAVADQVLEG